MQEQDEINKDVIEFEQQDNKEQVHQYQQDTVKMENTCNLKQRQRSRSKETRRVRFADQVTQTKTSLYKSLLNDLTKHKYHGKEYVWVKEGVLKKTQQKFLTEQSKEEQIVAKKCQGIDEEGEEEEYDETSMMEKIDIVNRKGESPHHTKQDPKGMQRNDNYHQRDSSPSHHHFDRKPYNQYEGNYNNNNNYDIKYDKKRLFLKGVPKNLTQAMARQVFERYGNVVRFDQPKFTSGQTKDYCFVFYDNEQSAEKAMNDKSHIQIFGQKIDIEYAKEKEVRMGHHHHHHHPPPHHSFRGGGGHYYDNYNRGMRGGGGGGYQKGGGRGFYENRHHDNYRPPYKGGYHGGNFSPRHGRDDYYPRGGGGFRGGRGGGGFRQHFRDYQENMYRSDKYNSHHHHQHHHHDYDSQREKLDSDMPPQHEPRQSRINQPVTQIPNVPIPTSKENPAQLKVEEKKQVRDEKKEVEEKKSKTNAPPPPPPPPSSQKKEVKQEKQEHKQEQKEQVVYIDQIQEQQEPGAIEKADSHHQHMMDQTSSQGYSRRQDTHQQSQSNCNFQINSEAPSATNESYQQSQGVNLQSNDPLFNSQTAEPSSDLHRNHFHNSQELYSHYRENYRNYRGGSMRGGNQYRSHNRGGGRGGGGGGPYYSNRNRHNSPPLGGRDQQQQQSNQPQQFKRPDRYYQSHNHHHQYGGHHHNYQSQRFPPNMNRERSAHELRSSGGYGNRGPPPTGGQRQFQSGNYIRGPRRMSPGPSDNMAPKQYYQRRSSGGNYDNFHHHHHHNNNNTNPNHHHHHHHHHSGNNSHPGRFQQQQPRNHQNIPYQKKPFKHN